MGSGSRKGQEEEDSKRQLMIPFFSLLVKDLYFLNEGCANRLVFCSLLCMHWTAAIVFLLLLLIFGS